MDPKYKDAGDSLTRLAEECAEVIQACMKIKRFGVENYHPDDPNKLPNRYRLEAEMQDVLLVWNQVKSDLNLDSNREGYPG